MAKLEARASIVDEMLHRNGMRESQIKDIICYELGKSLSKSIIEKADLIVFRPRGSFECGYRTDFGVQIHVFLTDKELEDYVKTRAKQMIDKGSVA